MALLMSCAACCTPEPQLVHGARIWTVCCVNMRRR